jgi:hypothetical protein
MAPGFILTGTVEHGGLVGPVGGIKEKIDATGNNGSFRTMAIPAASLDDFSGNVLDSLYFPDYARTKYNLTVVLVPNISYAAAIATGKIAAPAAQQASEFFPDEYSPAPQSEPFKLVASLVMSQMSDASDGTNLTPLQKQAFARLAGRARGQLSQGYYYTAANSAFLVKNALDQLRLYPLSKGEFLRVAENLRSEIESFKCALSSSNWEWASAGRLRKAWSGARLADALAQSNSSGSIPQPGLSVNLAASLNWFEAAKSLCGVSAPSPPAGFRPEAQAQAQASDFIITAESKANKTASADPEVFFHLNQSKKLFANGEYYAALMDASYSYAYALAEGKLADTLSESSDPLGDASGLASSTLYSVAATKNFESLQTRSALADLFYAHAYYKLAQGQENSDLAPLMDSYKLAILADAFQKISDFAAGGAFILPAGNLTYGLPTSGKAPTPKPPKIVVSIPPGIPSVAPSGGAVDAKITVTPSGANRDLLLYGLAVIALGMAVLVAVAAMKRLSGKGRFRDESDLDRLFLEGRLGPEDYERLRKKYFPKKAPDKEKAVVEVNAKPAAATKAAPKGKPAARKAAPRKNAADAAGKSQ